MDDLIERIKAHGIDTAMLNQVGMSFEQWLRYCQLGDKGRAYVDQRVIESIQNAMEDFDDA